MSTPNFSQAGDIRVTYLNIISYAVEFVVMSKLPLSPPLYIVYVAIIRQYNVAGFSGSGYPEILPQGYGGKGQRLNFSRVLGSSSRNLSLIIYKSGWPSTFA